MTTQSFYLSSKIALTETIQIMIALQFGLSTGELKLVIILVQQDSMWVTITYA